MAWSAQYSVNYMSEPYRDLLYISVIEVKKNVRCLIWFSLFWKSMNEWNFVLCEKKCESDPSFYELFDLWTNMNPRSVGSIVVESTEYGAHNLCIWLVESLASDAHDEETLNLL